MSRPWRWLRGTSRGTQAIPNEVMQPQEQELLVAYAARSPLILEIGAYLGKSTVAMSLTGSEVHTVDWHRGDPHLGERDTLAEYWETLKRHGVEDRVVSVVGDKYRVLPLLPEHHYDLVFADATHTYRSTLDDALAAMRLAKPEGHIAFHDYDHANPPYGEQVARAVDDFCHAQGYEIVERAISLVVCRARD